MYGAKSVSVGSAGGYVEKFYTDRGYIPQCYKLWVDDKPVIAKEFSDIADYYSYVRADDGGFVVMENGVAVETGTYEELMKKKGKFYELKCLNEMNLKTAEQALS